MRASLEIERKDSIEIKQLKTNILSNFNHRFPLREIHVVAALLDPRFQNLLEIREYLKENNITAVDLLLKWLKKTKLANQDEDEAEPMETDNENKASTSNSQSQPQSYIDELIEKHSTLTSVAAAISTSKISICERECHFLLSMGSKIEIKDTLNFWINQAKSMPTLSKLASKILCIPVTSTPSERNFSVAGLIIDSKRSRLSPDNLDAILFIHNNYIFIKEDKFSNM